MGSSVANTVGAGVGGNVEAPLVSLHNVDAGAHRVVGGHWVLSAGFAYLDEVNAGGTATVNGAHINVVLDAATSDARLVDGLHGVVHGVLEEHG